MDKACNLSSKKCVPCSGKTPPLKGKELEELHSKLKNGWKIIDGKQIEKEFSFPNFLTALAFTNKIGEIAEREGHHPDVHLSWGKVKIILWTHEIGGLSESDFIVAAKCDEIPK